MSRAIRFLQVCADRGVAPGSTKGAAQHLRGIAAGLLDLGHDVTTVAARTPEGPFPAEVRPLAELAELADRVDVVYERCSLGHTDGLDAARRGGAVFVLEVNAPLVDEARRHRPDTVADDHAGAEARLLAEADAVIVVSDELAHWARERRDGPVVVIPNGFEPSWFPAAASPATSDTLVFLGHPKPWHGAGRLVGLLAGLAAHGHEPHLLVVGGGPGADEIRLAADRIGLGDQVEVTGALPPTDASALLQGAAIGLAPYPPQADFYFCPLKIVDYLAAGLPIVATCQGAAASLVGDAGIVVPADDEDAFVDAVAELLGDPVRRTQLGASGRARAWASMTWDDAAAATVAALDTDLAIGAHRG
jgi:glycosyltransferase involved in cell wall biosynthesis